MGCKLQEPLKTHGIIFLENRAAKLTINQSNKNDTVKILGQPQIKSDEVSDSPGFMLREFCLRANTTN